MLNKINERFVVSDEGKIKAFIKITSDSGLSMEILFAEIRDDESKFTLKDIPICDNRTMSNPYKLIHLIF